MFVNWRKDRRLVNKSLINDVSLCHKVWLAVSDYLDRFDVRGRFPIKMNTFPDGRSREYMHIWWWDFCDWMVRTELEVVLTGKSIWVQNKGAKTPTWV